LKSKNSEFYNKNNTLLKENNDLKKEVEKLKPFVGKLTLSSNKLELIFKDQRISGNKAGIGFNTSNSNYISATTFVKQKDSIPKFTPYKTFVTKGSTSISKPVVYVPKNLNIKPIIFFTFHASRISKYRSF